MRHLRELAAIAFGLACMLGVSAAYAADPSGNGQQWGGGKMARGYGGGPETLCIRQQGRSRDDGPIYLMRGGMMPDGKRIEMFGRDGGMHGFGMGPQMFRLFHELNLTDEQRHKIIDIFADQQKEKWTVMGDMMDARSKMHKLMSEDQPDPRKVGEAFAAVSKLQGRMLVAQVRMRNRIWDVLTKEQRAKLKEHREHHHAWPMRMKGARTVSMDVPAVFAP